jgi:hypothetical protein
VEGFIQTLIELAGTLIWPLEDFLCFAHVHGFFPLFVHASQLCLLIPFKSFVISAIIRVPMGVFLRELSLSVCLDI